MAGMKIVVDPEELTRLHQLFTTKAHEVHQVQSDIGTNVNNATWQGQQAERFRSDWASVYLPGLQRLEQALNDAGTDISQALARAMAGDGQA